MLLDIKRTDFNRAALSKMTYEQFLKIFRGRFHENVDLKAVFVKNGGKSGTK